MTEAIIMAIIGSGVLSTIVSAIITAISNRKSKLKDIEKKLEEIEKNQVKAEKDALRTQLLVMIADFPDETTDILRLAEHYFKDLDGNWVASALFNEWAKEHCESAPTWAKK